MCDAASKRLCYEIDCEVCYLKSFASHPMAESWSPKNKFTSRSVTQRSDKKAWFDCKDCNHSFECSLFSLKKDKVCVYCSNQRLCNKEECARCFQKTFASLPLVSRWSQKNTAKPHEVFKYSNKKFLFDCDNCLHEYETTANHVVNRNGSCPFCVSNTLCKNQDCKLCFTRSFASSPKVRCWSSKNTLKPRDCFIASDARIIFNCDVCTGEFSSQLYNVKAGYWCPHCKNKTEGVIYKFLLQENPLWKRQANFNWCKNEKTDRHMPYDFCLESSKLLIELDGRQHFEQVAKWGTPEEIQRRDLIKNKKALEHGYTLIHLLQEDVWFNTYDWKATLKEHLVTTITPQIVFLETGTTYESQIATLDD
jgi:very-short-patch-repair endonuclease